jgi:hypothetical protein
MPRGSQPGERRGGRRKGTPNKAAAARQAAISASGLTPLDYLLSLMRDETADPRTRLDAAKSAAPFVHPRLGQVDPRHAEPGFVPLHERILYYESRDRIEAAKVVESSPDSSPNGRSENR